MYERDSPSSPNGVDTCALRDIDDKVDIGVIVVVRSTGDFNISVGHPDVLGIDSQVFGSGHDGELYCALGPESLVGPFSDRSDFLDGGDTVVGDKDLELSAATRII
jgi:hypothetical protein